MNVITVLATSPTLYLDHFADTVRKVSAPIERTSDRDLSSNLCSLLELFAEFHTDRFPQDSYKCFVTAFNYAAAGQIPLSQIFND